MVTVTMDYRAEQKIEMASTRSGLELWMEKLELEHHWGISFNSWEILRWNWGILKSSKIQVDFGYMLACKPANHVLPNS